MVEYQQFFQSIRYSNFYIRITHRIIKLAPKSMFQSQSFHIQQATILFCSNHYNHLKCRIVQKSTSTILSSKLINNCLETAFNINCDLEDFTIQLLQTHVMVASFSFTSQDLDQVMNQSDNNQNTKYSFKQGVKKKKKYMKFKKENDSCSLYLTIQVRDLICVQDTNFNDGFLYQDFIRNIAQKVSKNLEIKAIYRIKKFEKIKLGNKKLSLQMSEPISIKKPALEQNLQQIIYNRYQSSGDPEDQNQLDNKQQLKKQVQFSRTWIGLQSPASNLSKSCKGSNTYIELKNECKLRKMRDKVKKIFHKQIQQKKAMEMIIIPQIRTRKMDVKTIRLLSEGIVLPSRRVSSEAIEDMGIKLSGFLHQNCGYNTKHNNFSSQILRSESSQMNVKREKKEIRNKLMRRKSQKQKIKQYRTKYEKKQMPRMLKKESSSTKCTQNFKCAVKFR